MHRATQLTLATLASLALCASPAFAQSLRLAPFGGQSFDQPFHVTGPPGDPSGVFVVEGPGRIRLVRNGVTRPAPFLDISGSVFDAGEGCGSECGLFSMAPAPDYSSSGLFYVFYTRDFNPGNHYLRIQEFRRSAANPDIANPASGRIVLEIPHTAAANHNGGQLQFGPDGLLYIWVGDGGSGQSANAQNLTTRLGKILRINPRGPGPFNYSIPAGNPFADGPGGRADEIYSYGLRNPWRGSFDRSTGDLTIGDVGQTSWEEIDFRPEGLGSGANFGWDCFEGTAPFSGCTPSNHSPPVLQYPNPGTGPAAVAGGFVIRDSALPAWRGRYIYGDTYAALGNRLRTAVLGPGGASGDAALGLATVNLVSFGQDACGHIYTADIGTGRVNRLQPLGAPFPCKLGPELFVNKKPARKTARKGAVVIGARCDEDCAVSAEALIVIKPQRKAARSAGRRKKRRLRARAVWARLQWNETRRLRLELSRKQTRKLRKALRRGRRAVVRIEASATGGGGGTDVVKKRARVKRK